MKQADSAQNKRTANEVESFKIKMFQTKDGLFFYRTRFFHERPMLATSPTAFGEHYSVSAAGSSVKPSPSTGRFNRSD